MRSALRCAVFEQMRGNDQAAPREQSLRRRKAGAREPLRNRTLGQGEQSGQPLRREPLVRTRHRQEQRVTRRGIDAIEGHPHEGAEASRLGLFDRGE